MIRRYLSDSIRPAAFLRAATTAYGAGWCLLAHVAALRCTVLEHSRRSLNGRQHAPYRPGLRFFPTRPPWALSFGTYATPSIDGLKAAGNAGPERPSWAIYIRNPSSHRIAACIWFPGRRWWWSAWPACYGRRQQRQPQKYSRAAFELRRPKEGHLLGSWLGGLAFREPPYDLGRHHRRL